MTDLLHLFHSEKSDGADNTLVQPSDWNDAHVVGAYDAAVASVMVAASNATDREKANALLSGGTVCDGSNDEADWAAAQTLVGARGLVLLSSGDFAIQDNITLTATFRGVGGASKRSKDVAGGTRVTISLTKTISFGKDGNLQDLFYQMAYGHTGVGVKCVGEVGFAERPDLMRGTFGYHRSLGDGLAPAGSIVFQIYAVGTSGNPAYVQSCHFIDMVIQGGERGFDIYTDGVSDGLGWVNSNTIKAIVHNNKYSFYLTRNSDYGSADVNNITTIFEADGDIPTAEGILLYNCSDNIITATISDWNLATGAIMHCTGYSSRNRLIYVGASGTAYAHILDDDTGLGTNHCANPIASAPIFIASSTSTDAEKNQALASGGDICTGTDDAVKINALIASGRHIILGSGTFNIDTPIQVWANNFTLEGQGREATILKNITNATLSYDGYLATVYAYKNGTTYTNVTLKGFTIDGNRANQTTKTSYSLVVKTQTSVNLEDIYFTNTCKTSLYITGTLAQMVVHSKRLKFDNSIDASIQGSYVYCSATDSNCFWDDCEFYNSGTNNGGAQPFYLNNGEHYINNCYFYHCDTCIDVRGASQSGTAHAYVKHCRIDGGQHGWYTIVLYDDDNTIDDVYITGQVTGAGTHTTIIKVLGDRNHLSHIRTVGVSGEGMTMVQFTSADNNILRDSNITNDDEASNDGVLIDFAGTSTGNQVIDCHLETSYWGVKFNATGTNYIKGGEFVKSSCTKPIGDQSNVEATTTPRLRITNISTADATHTVFGEGALQHISTGINALAIGYNALHACTTADDNIAIGNNALQALTTGLYSGGSYGQNVAVGHNALQAATFNSSQNTAIGNRSMYYCTEGLENTAVGHMSLAYTTSGDLNTAIGQNALMFATTASWNTAVGSECMMGNVTDKVTGQRNSALGNNCLDQVTTGDSNVSMGHWSGHGITDGSYNVCIGTEAGAAGGFGHAVESMGSWNILIGNQAGYSHDTTIGDYNTIIGEEAGYTGAVGSYNIFLGRAAGFYATGDYQLIVNSVKTASTAEDATKSILYGVMSATTANQYLTLNGKLNLGTSIDSATGTDVCSLSAFDTSAGHRSLAISTEETLVSESVTSDRTLLVRINGVNVKICCKA